MTSRVWHQPDPDEVGSPQAWLYVSRRLDLEWLPNEPVWSGRVVSLGTTANPTAFYRLSPSVLAWLEAAGQNLELDHLTGNLPAGQLDEYLRVMAVVWDFARERLAAEAVRKARSQPVALPDPAVPK